MVQLGALLSGAAMTSPPSRTTLCAVLALGYGVSMLAYRPSVMMAMPALLAGLGEPMSAGGTLLSLGATAYMVFKPGCQIMSDSWDARTMLIWSVLASGALFVCIGLSNTLGQIQVLFVLLHAAQAMHSP